MKYIISTHEDPELAKFVKSSKESFALVHQRKEFLKAQLDKLHAELQTSKEQFWHDVRFRLKELNLLDPSWTSPTFTMNEHDQILYTGEECDEICKCIKCTIERLINE